MRTKKFLHALTCESVPKIDVILYIREYAEIGNTLLVNFHIIILDNNKHLWYYNHDD